MQLNPREHFLFGAQVVRNASTLHHHTDLYVLTGHKGFIDRVAVVEQDRHLAEHGVHLPQPLGLRQQHIRIHLVSAYCFVDYLGHQLAVDNVVLHTLGVEAEDGPVGVGAEPHVDEGDGAGVRGEAGQRRAGPVVPGVQGRGAPAPDLGHVSHL